jgi:heptosyltransferase-1
MTYPANILIVKLSAIGDVVHALPFLEVLKERFPGSRIDWLVEEEASQIIEGHHALEKVIISRRKSWQKKLLKGGHFISVPREICDFLKELRSRNYDLVIDLQGLLKSGILVGLSKGKRKIGMAGSREGAWIFLNEPRVPVIYAQHAIDRYLQMAGHLECDPSSWEGDIPGLESAREFVDQFLKDRGLDQAPLVAVNPVAKWKTKLWKPERFAELADRICQDLGCEAIFTGSLQDRETIKGITERMKKIPIILAGEIGLKELACLYRKSRVLVTTDTGPMHIAAAVGCRVVALFGPTDPVRTGPCGNGHRVVRADAACSPCFKKSCEHMTCMEDIEVERVYQSVREILLENENGA